MARLRGTLGIVAVIGSAVVVATALAAPAYAGDSPGGFWYGTDTQTMPVRGSGPYYEPVIAASYGGYMGMVGSWAVWQSCPGTNYIWSARNSAQANANYVTYHAGVGTGVYWFMGGPGVDPHYNGTSAEAYAWGAAQAQRTAYDISHVTITYPVVWMDIELPGRAPSYTPAPDNGWNAVYTSACSGRVRQNYVPASLDRAEFNGFWDYIKYHTRYIPGVYSAPDVWAEIFGTGSAAYIPNTDEWTYEAFTSSLQNLPSGWCLRGSSTCAHFFGGVTASSTHALMWQWSGGGGSRNGYGDFDQIDKNRQL